MKYYKRMLGTRLYLSPLHTDDAEQLAEWNNDLSFSILMGHAAEMFSLAKVGRTLNEMSVTDHHFAVVDLQTDRFIGICALQGINLKDRYGTLMIFIGDPAFRNKGYGQEAVMLLLRYGFVSLNLHNVDLGVYEYNQAAIRCYEKCGFREFGRRRKAKWVAQKRYDIVWMDILSDDYFKREAASSHGAF